MITAEEANLFDVGTSDAVELNPEKRSLAVHLARRLERLSLGTNFIVIRRPPVRLDMSADTLYRSGNFPFWTTKSSSEDLPGKSRGVGTARRVWLARRRSAAPCVSKQRKCHDHRMSQGTVMSLHHAMNLIAPTRKLHIAREREIAASLVKSPPEWRTIAPGMWPDPLRRKSRRS